MWCPRHLSKQHFSLPGHFPSWLHWVGGRKPDLVGGHTGRTGGHFPNLTIRKKLQFILIVFN